MDEQLKELLNTLYEAEGLVEMALRRRVRPDDRIVRLVCEKCFLTARLASGIKLPETEDEACSENLDLPLYGASEPAREADEGFAEEDKEVDVFTNEILPLMSEDSDSADILDGSIFDSADADGGEAPADGREDGYVPDGEDEVADEVAEEVSDTDSVAESVASAAALRPSRKPVIGCFSINDKYRFRRELFSGSDALFRNSLALFEAMGDLSEARSYIFNDLGWDPENPDVKSFISILDRYYR